jgi:FMN phosphatase YigB (HAD superfamily)
MSHTLKRLLFQAGVPAADLEGFFTDDDMEYITSQYLKLKPRPGLAEMMQTLRDGGFEVWCCSDANIERVKGYFDNAGVPMPLENILSADMVKAGKPEPAVYKFAREKAGSDKPGEVSVFAGMSATPKERMLLSIQLHMLGIALRQSRRVSRLRIPRRTSLTSASRSLARPTLLPQILSRSAEEL